MNALQVVRAARVLGRSHPQLALRTAPRALGGAGFRVQGSGCRVQGAGFRVQGSGCSVQGVGFRNQGLQLVRSRQFREIGMLSVTVWV